MSNVSAKEKYFWNMMGSLSNSFSSLIMSICVNRILGGSSGGLFAFAYANAQLMLTVGVFEVRIFQSTDVKEKYSFRTYLDFRLITCSISIIVCAAYVFLNNFSKEKSIVVFLLVLYKIIEAFTDVYGGRFQQRDRIDLSGKTFFVRVSCSTVVFVVMLLLKKSLIAASMAMVVTSFSLFWLYDYRYIDIKKTELKKIKLNSILSLFVEVLPLFIGAFIMMYINNAPKYAINSMYSDEIQNIYGILSMPAFVINLFSIFIFRPLLLNMAIDWNEKRIKKLCKTIILMYLAIIAITIVAMIGTALIGIPILSFLYGINLEGYKMELVVVMFTGGLSALMSFSGNVIAVMRKSKSLLMAYGTAFAYVILFLDNIVQRYEIWGAVISYGIAVGLLVLLFDSIIVFGILNEGHKRNFNKQ